MLGERLGLAWRLEEHSTRTSGSALDGADDRVVTLPDVLFATDESRWLTPSALRADPAAAPAGRRAGAGRARRGRAPARALRRARRRPTAPLAQLDAPAVRCTSTCSAARSRCSPATRRRCPGSATATSASPPRRRSPPATASSASRSSTPTSSCCGRRCTGCGRDCGAARRDYRGAAHPRRGRPAVDRSAGAGRCSPASSPATWCGAGTSGSLLRRVRALADARRGRLRPRPAQHLRPPDGRERAPRAAQRLLLPVEQRREPARRPVRPRRPSLGRAADGPGPPRAGTRSASTPASAPSTTRSGPPRSSTACARSPSARGVRQEQWGGRQHYLQWANPTTWRNWDAAGLAYDCTLAFSEAVGFRTGTCHEYPVFDLVARRPLDAARAAVPGHGRHAVRVPGPGPGRCARRVLDVARACRRFRGDLGILVAQRRGAADRAAAALVRRRWSTAVTA